MNVDSKKGGPDRGSRVASSQRIDDGWCCGRGEEEEEEEEEEEKCRVVCGFAVLGGQKFELLF